MVGQDIPRSASPHSTMTDKGENKKGENKKEQRVEVAVLDGDLQGPALTWLSTASQADAVAFFRHMGVIETTIQLYQYSSSTTAVPVLPVVSNSCSSYV